MTSLTERIPLQELRDHYLVFEDGTVAVGYKLQGYEEEALSGAAYYQLVKALARALRDLPVGTILQKLDSYYPDHFHYVPHDKALFAHQDKMHL